MRDIATRGKSPGRQHHHPAADARPVRERDRLRDRQSQLGAEGQGDAGRRCASRSATPRKRSSRSTATRSISATAPTASRPRRSSISGKPAKELALEEAATHRRHHPGQRPAEPVRQSGGHASAAATTRSSGWPTKASSRARSPTPTKAKPVVVAGDPTGDGSVAPYFLEEVRKYLEAQVRREGALRERPDRARRRSTSGCSRPRTRRSIAACAASTSAAASGSRAATSSPKARRSMRSRSIAGRVASPKATSCPPWCAPSTTPRPCLRIGELQRGADARRHAVDQQEIAEGDPQGRRSDRRRDHARSTATRRR